VYDYSCINDRTRGSNEPEFREITGKEGDEGCQQCDICGRPCSVQSYEMGNEKRLTNTSKIAIDRPQHHDRRDAVQTDHAENKNAARGGRYDHQPGHADIGCNKSGRQSTYQASPIQKYQLDA
jgi:ferredoxin